MRAHRLLPLPLALVISCAGTRAPVQPGLESYAPIPDSVRTPSAMSTRLGELRFFDGLPSRDTVATVYDNLDFQRALRAYLDAIPGASMQAIKNGMDAAGALPNYTVLLARLDSKAIFPSANTETVYAMAWLSLKGGPIAVVVPPQVSGFFTDAWQRHLGDAGRPGPDRGKGGLYVVVPPGYTGYVPRTKYALRSKTLGVWAVFRAPMVKGKTSWGVRQLERGLKVYPLKEAKRPPPNQFVEVSGAALSMVHPSGPAFFESIHALLQEEPAESQDPELLGSLAAVGIAKGQPFSPDARMQAILGEAAAVGEATARALVFYGRGNDADALESSHWRSLSGDARDDGVAALDRRAAFYFHATERPSSVSVGERGLQRAAVFVDGEGRRLDGAFTYSMRLPPSVPGASWSVVAYDNQTRSMLQTDQRFPSLSNERRLPIDDDGAITLYFGPKPPRKAKSRWIQTVPGKGFHVVLHIDRPKQAWFDGAWVPGELERLRGGPETARRKRPPRMATETPAAMPDRVVTRLGALEHVDGVPTKATAELLFENLDFMRAVEAFLTMLPSASLVATRRGLRDAGVDGNEEIGVFDRGVDSHSLVLTGDPEIVFATTWLDLRKGGMVVESPPGVLGFVQDFGARRVTHIGPGGPDEGKGGLFLFVPEGYDGQLSERYFAYRSQTYGNLLSVRGADPVVEAGRLRSALEVYPFDVDFDDLPEDGPSAAPEDERAPFVPLSGRSLNTLPPNDARFFDDIATLIREEPTTAFSSELLGLLQSLGIESTRGFAPDAKKQALLSEAAQVGNATARALAFQPRGSRAEGSRWVRFGVGESAAFARNGAHLLDARTAFFFLATMGSAAGPFALAVTDAEGRYLDGARVYRLVLPADMPAALWSVAVYDPQTRSLLQTPNTTRPWLSSGRGLPARPDGSIEVFFGPKPSGSPAASNWIETVPGKGWFAVLRLREPKEAWLDATWQPANIQRID